jgi:LPXTG-motif cell wall-anchored protein
LQPAYAPGETKGQGVGNVWYVIPPVATVGCPATGLADAPVMPVALPQTGESDASPLGALALLALLSAAIGFVVRSRLSHKRV